MKKNIHNLLLLSLLCGSISVIHAEDDTTQSSSDDQSSQADVVTQDNDESTATPTIAEQCEIVVDAFRSMSDSFVVDSTVFESFYTHINILTELLNTSDTKRSHFFNTIISWFDAHTQSANLLQSSYDALQEISAQQAIQIANLENQIADMTTQAQQEHQSLTDTITFLQNEISAFEASYTNLTAEQLQNVQNLMAEFKALNSQYQNMLITRDQFVENMNDFSTIISAHFTQEQSEAQAIAEQIQLPA